MKYLIEYLERKIEGCDALGGLEREKAIYQSVLKDYRKQCDIPIVIESLVCPNGCVKDFNNIGDGLVECKECSCVQQTNVL